MKYMGWSWLDYCHTPLEIIEEAAELMREEAEEAENQRGMSA